MAQITRRQAAAEYKKIARRLHQLQVDASPHISRRDNNQVFEIAFFLENIANRIKNEYPDADYPRLLK